MEAQYQEDIDKIVARIIDLSVKVKNPDRVVRIYHVLLDVDLKVGEILYKIREEENSE